MTDLHEWIIKCCSQFWTDRLSAVISPLVDPDQTGFIPNRQITENIRLTTNIIQDSNTNSKSTLLLSLDIHKAFDSVSWSYLDTLLPKYGINNEFLHGFKALYHNPQTRIKLPGNNSDFFPLTKGTRQGCPLSPLLFALAIEPLACAIRNNIDIKGYSKGSKEYKLSLYADDVLLFITDPLISLPNLTKTLAIFHDLTGLSVNLSKCSALPINIPPALIASLKDKFSFNWNMDSFRYLGIQITSSYKTFYQANYPPLFNSIKNLLKLWSSYQISFSGRIVAVKMMILPKLLFFFRALPLILHKKNIRFLTERDQQIHMAKQETQI